MKQQANRHRIEKTFGEGDWVLLKLQPHRQHSVPKRHSSKFLRCFFGPFQAKKCIGEVAYHLQLSEEARIHDVFHVSLLKAWKGEPPQEVSVWPEMLSNKSVGAEPGKVMGKRIVKRGCKLYTQLLIHWKGSHPKTPPRRIWRNLS